MERAERRHAVLGEQVVNSEVLLAEKERQLTVVADQMEQNNAEVVKQKCKLKYRKEEVDQKRK